MEVTHTTIRVRKDIADRLREIGNMGDSYSDVLDRLLGTTIAVKLRTELGD